MTRQREIDRVLEGWFLDGPTAMPDRVFEAVLDRVERVPQRRIARLQLRFHDMSTTARLLAAGAAAILLVGVGFVTFGRTPSTGPGASPPSSTIVPSAPASASASASPQSTPGTPAPAALQHSFLGAFRDGPGAPSGQDRSILDLSGTYFQYNDHLLESAATAAGADQIRLVSTSTAGGCRVGDEGVYSWATSQAESRLTFTAVREACAARFAVVPGDWQRSACRNPDNLCLGPIPAGAYSSEYIDPFHPDADPWTPGYGRITYTVPAGWENDSDYPEEYHLQRAGSDNDSGIWIWSDVVIVSNATPCEEIPESTVGRTPRALVDWLAAAPGLVVSAPTAVTIGGQSGWRVDVAMAKSWTKTCSFSEGRPTRPIFTDGTTGGGFHWGLGVDTHMRLFILENGNGRALVLDIEAQDRSAYDGQLEDAMAIVESMDFHRP